MGKLFAFLGVVVLLGLGLSVFVMWKTYNNTEIELRNTAEAQRGNIEASFDAMWKIIRDNAKVTDKYKDAFKDVFMGMTEARYEKGDGSLMKLIVEANPNFDTRLFEKLMTSIEANRKSFEFEQKKMLDYIREHKTYKSKFPASLFIGDRKDIEYTIVSSTKTKETMRTGLDDEEAF